MKKILLNFLLAIFFIIPIFGQDVFINEIKYQAPIGEEFIEVSGPSGDSITGWEIILYDETPLPYDTISLEGELPDTEGCNGIVVVDVAVLFTTPGSGMALVDAQGQLVQYLTYGDTTTGTINSGIIDGVTSENIGTQLESFGSLQLTGIGETYTDFTWNLIDVATPDEVNINQTFDGEECTLPLVLPVELVEFKGAVQGENIVLSWLTLSETNHSHFEILHSTTGAGMEEVGRVYEAISESGGTKKYEFVFSNIIHANNYFQLRQVDVDGKNEWSDMISVSMRTDEPIKISPNPATDFIDIEIQFENIGRTDEANIMIIDSQGKNVFTKPTALSELDRISIESLASGLYILVVQSGTISKQIKFIKRK